MDSVETYKLLATESVLTSEMSSIEGSENIKLKKCNKLCEELCVVEKNTCVDFVNIDTTENSIEKKSGCGDFKEIDTINTLDIFASRKVTDSFSENNTINTDSEAEMEMSEVRQSNNLEQTESSSVDLLKLSSKKHKTMTIIDNDIKNKFNISKELCSNITTENQLIAFKSFSKTKKFKRLAIVDTDSESEDSTPHNKSFNSDVINTGTEPRTPILDSDSETESITIANQRIFGNIKENNSINTDIESGNYYSNNKGNNSYTNSSKNNGTETIVSITSLNDNFVPDENSVQRARLALLCDSDSDEEPSSYQLNSTPVVSDDEIVDQSQHVKETKTNTTVPWLCKKTSKNSVKKTKTKNAAADISKKMTPKEAAELRKEIQSESQRMMRDKNVSLPYHKPKTHSLKEFLARRPKLAVTVPTNTTPPSVAIKMTTQQLEIISKKLKEREKEVKEFYKSESESENDDSDYVPPTSDTNQLNNVAKETSDENLQVKESVASIDAEKFDICTEVLEITNTSHEENTQGKKHEAESLLPNNDIQTAAIIQNDIDHRRVSVQLGTEPTVSTPETTHEGNSESDDISETGKYKKNIGDPEKMVDLFSPLSNNISPQISTEVCDFYLNEEHTTKLVSSDNLLNNQQTLNLGDNSEEIGPEVCFDTSKLEQEPLSRPFTYDDFDMEIENFENLENQRNITKTPLDENSLPPIKSKLDILKEKLTNVKPKLSGGPDTVIDLSSALVKPKEVVELMERFSKHVTSKKHNSKHKVKMSVLTVESGGDIHKETVAVNVDSDETEIHEEKPGAKLQRLREELQKQMDQKKSEIWQQKAAKGIRGNGESCYDSENSEKDGKDILSNEEEDAEMTEDEDSEEEIEDDIELFDKPLRESEFLDQEAEESEEEETFHKEDYKESILNEDEISKESLDNESENLEKEREGYIMSNEQTLFEPPESKSESLLGKKRVLRRILKPVDDSDEEDLFSDSTYQKATSNEQLDSTVTADEDDIPPHQTRQLQTPMRQAVSQTKSISDFLTPISFITSIQNLASTTKSNKNGPAISPFRMTESPTMEERSAVSQKKLFTDSELTDSQGSLNVQVIHTQDSLSDLGQENEIGYLQRTQPEKSDEPPSTQDLMGICSGEFTGVTHLDPSLDTKKLIEFDGSQSTEFGSLGTDQDMVISQLLDEEELENFKKKFESPVNPVVSIIDEAQEVIGGGIIDSDDEDKENYGLGRKKNQKRIQFSDDESLDEEKDISEEKIDLHDSDVTDEEEIDNIGYDSEENEIDLNKIEKKDKLKMADFLDAEAELSESEWGSEDEDEKDMDKLEFELGDTDKFDEEQVKEDLEKIHLRRMLDDDAREVKLLQEVLLEDGEMHGTGRHRQFKWKNIDLNNDQTEEKTVDEIYLDEEESEEQWRKRRHEREMYLKEKQHKSEYVTLDDNDLLNHSQLLKIGHKVLQKSQSQNNLQSSTPKEATNGLSSSPASKIPFSLSSKRGSFLSRSDQVLQRVTEYTKITTDVSVNSNKTTKNFLFQSVSSSSEVTVASEEDKKRKASDGTPNVLKKLRLSTNFSPAIKKKTERSKKLFNF